MDEIHDDAASIYPSDAPDSDIENYNPKDLSRENNTKPFGKYAKSEEGNHTHIQRNSELQCSDTIRTNGLSQSFIQSDEISDSQETMNISDTASLNGTEELHKNYPTSEETVTLAPLVEDENGTVPIKIILHEPHIHGKNEENDYQEFTVLQTGNPDYHGHLKNWDWSENNNNKSEEKGVHMIVSEESTEQSVEVVHHKSPKRRKRKRKKTKGKFQRSNWMMTHIHETAEHLTTQDSYLLQEENATRSLNAYLNQTKNCELSQSCEGAPSNSLVQESHQSPNAQYDIFVERNSMVELVNQTQKLVDWYHKQNVNDTSSEEEHGRSNILKARIIEHYSKLLPWLHFNLTPKSEKSSL